MAWDSAGSSDGYDTGSYPPGPGGASGASWAVIGIAVAVLGVLLVGVAVWIVRLQASAEQVPQVTSLAPQAAAAAPGGGSSSAGGSSPGGTSVSAGSTGTSAAPSSPLDRVDQAWAAKAATATGISDRAFLAYASADLTIEAEQPACGLGWNTLAAIATVESANGTFGGATVLANGYTSKPIVGVPLNGGTFGGQKLAAIPATDGGWQRAVGPFQFIPSTWAKWGADGNGDGVISPDQIDDAALAAARYLCASGPMTTPAGWRAAVFSYNQSDAYVNEVADIANRYAAEATGLS